MPWEVLVTYLLSRLGGDNIATNFGVLFQFVIYLCFSVLYLCHFSQVEVSRIMFSVVQYGWIQINKKSNEKGK